MDRQTLGLLNGTILISFVTLLSLALFRIGKRYIDYKKLGQSIPLLLKRDFFFLSGLTIPFLGVLIFRFFGIVISEQGWYPLWVIGSGGFGLFGTLFWVYVEYFKIEK